MNTIDPLYAKSLGGEGGAGGGGDGAGVDGGTSGKDLYPIKAKDGENGKGGGGGGGVSYSGADETAGNGGNGVVIIRLSGFVVRSIPLPEQGRTFVYDGREKVGVDEFFAYTFKKTGDYRNDPVGVNADQYVVTVNIADDAPYGWGDVDPDDPTYHGDRVIRWKIVPHKVTVPKTYDDGFVYKTTSSGGTVTYTWNAYENQDADAQGRCWTVLETGAPSVHYCTVSGYKAGDAGDYKMKCVLNNDYESTINVTNFYWAASDRLGDKLVDWSIAQADNAITKLTIENWQEGTTNKTPTVDWTWSKVATAYGKTGTVDKVQYEWRKEDGNYPGDPKALDEGFEFPTEAGRYRLRAYICKDSNHEPGNWVEAEREIAFVVWRHPAKTFRDYVDIYTTGSAITSSGSAQSDFPVLVRLKEPTRDAYGAITGGLPGFSYGDVRDNGYGLRFVAVSNLAASAVAPSDKTNPYARDTLLPFEVDTWNPSGESLVWVKVPKVWRGTKFRMYWRPKPGAEIREDLKPFETWANGYVGVWHLNGKNMDGALENSTGVDPLGRDSTLRNSALDATGNVSFVSAKFGVGVKGNDNFNIAASMQALGLAGDKFTYTAWARVPQYSSGQVSIIGNKAGKNWNYNPGWTFFMNNGKTALGVAANDTWNNANITTDLTTNWRFLGYVSSGLSARTGYYEGTGYSVNNSTTVFNDLPLTAALKGNETDEVRVSSVNRDSNWMKAEYDTVNNAAFCTFGLVNQEQGDGTRAWVNWWSTAPWSAARGVAGTDGGRYWREGQLDPKTVTNSYFGALAKLTIYTTSLQQNKIYGTVGATYTAMPSGEQVVFPKELGPYKVDFTMANKADGPTPFPGLHVIFDGDRQVDIEIVRPEPGPIEPTGDVGATLSGRVLLANDYEVADKTNGVAGQGYWRTAADGSLNPFWEHGGEPAPELGLNLRSGTEHVLRHIVPQGEEPAATNALWKLSDVYVGNLMTNDDTLAATSALSNRWNELPWSPKSRAISSAAKETEEGELTNRSEVAQLVMRNLEGASIESQVFTNGIGAVYFDAVNAYAKSDVKAVDYRLAVEVAGTNAALSGWTALEVKSLYVNGTAVTTPSTAADEVNCLNVQNGGKLDSFKFYRICAKVPDELSHEPLRFRIRRVSARAVVEEEGFDPVAHPDDPDGFILIDNVIASWPTDAAAVGPCGTYDPTLVGKQVLGQEGGVSAAYPTADDTFYAFGRLTDGEKSTVKSARLHYRWRYVNARFDPAKLGEEDVWRVDYLNITNDVFATLEPLKYKRAPGDVEYWYDITVIAPYYKYVDYSGLALSNPTGTFTEEPAMNSESRSKFGDYPSGGTDWFVRLRESRSENRRAVLKVDGRADLGMELIRDHVWRGYLKTPEGLSEGLRFRIELQQWSAPGDLSVPVVTNFWYYDRDVTVLPTSLTLKTDGTTNSWTRVPVDGNTGYLMFQVDDTTRSVSIVHGDYQDFNMWDDAKDDVIFKGNASDLGKKGVSPKKREYDETFTYRSNPGAPLQPWDDTPSVSTNWTETFETLANQHYADYVPFPGDTTLGGWSVGPGMYVYQWYKYGTKIPNTAEGIVYRALQLEGCGQGWLQFPLTGTFSENYMPRGIGTVSFKARLGQFVEDPFADASYADPFDEETAVRQNYTFLTLAAFDQNSNNGFAGNASLSLYGYYNDRLGMYELRYEQVGVTLSGTTVTGPGNGRRLSLYRWKYTRGTGLVPTLLGSRDVSDAKSVVKTDGPTGNYLPIFLSCWAGTDNKGNPATFVRGGIWYADAKGVAYNAALPGAASAKNYQTLVCIDTDAARLAAGTYGVLSANCDGVFLRPHVGTKVTTGKTAAQKKDGHSSAENEDGAVTFSGFVSCEDDIIDSCDPENMSFGLAPWVLTPGRMKVFHDDGYRWGVRNDALEQRVSVQVKPRGKDAAWETVRTFPITGFGAAGKSGQDCTVRMDRTENLDMRLKVEGTLNDARTDVIVDDVQVTQWRGCAYGDVPDTAKFVGPDDRNVPGWPTNFVFSSGWVKDGAILLSPKRTAGWTSTDKACAIRSPLLDGMGYPARGCGLGLIAFTYRNAQENAKLLVQIATNNVGSSLSGYDTVSDDSRWTTVTNVDFSAMSEKDRKSGRVDLYLGLHGVPGLMRVMADPKVVEQVSTNTWLDATKYGEVEITHIYGRDEPALDLTAWTGWNMQTTDRDDRQFLVDNRLFGAANGLSLGLNNSVDDDVEDDPETYRQQMPYVQTPTFLSNTVGEVTFRARKYDSSESSQNAEVSLYGGVYDPVSRSIVWKCSDLDEPVARFIVSNTTWTTYSHKTKPGEGYTAFRLGVTGVPTVSRETRGPDPTEGDRPVRVLIEEVLVTEAIRPQVGFRSCWPIRSALTGTAAVPGAGTAAEQPIMGDAWTVQAEIEVKLLPDELDLVTHPPRVVFHWFPGESPWGYQNWKGHAKAKEAELALADGESMVFRGSYLTAPLAMVMAEPSGATYTYRTYQYMAEVIYYDTKGNCITGQLSQTEWRRPAWYAPVDLNASQGRNVAFSAYNILESVAPGRAWINEANVFDGRDANYEYPAAKNQYVEIAVPLGQSLRNWKLNYIDNSLATNLLCIFGLDGVAESKTLNPTNNYVFMTVQSPKTRDAKTLDAAKGEVDGTWQKFDSTGELDQTHPIGLQLVRPSGIVANEVVLDGTNTWTGTAYEQKYSAEKRVETLNASDPDRLWYLAGHESSGGDATTSLGVTNVNVAATRPTEVTPTEMWTARGRHTPGEVNEWQVIPEGWAVYPSGDMLIVNATVVGPHVRQTVGEATNSIASVMVAVKKGSGGTNITYNLDTWYEVAEIRENNVLKASGKPDGFAFAAGDVPEDSTEGMITVTATARPRGDLATKYGLTPQNRYTEAVIDWLERGKTMKGDFAYPGSIDLPKIRDLAGNFVTNLTLTETYWFDIDPTGSNWCFKAGTKVAPHEVRWPPTGDTFKTNVQLGVYMVITNESTTGAQAGLSWSPYVLRSEIPGVDSQQYARRETNRWESVNFKITADMLDGLPLRARWVPLRYFVFTEGSFDENHLSTIEIPHPFSPDSLSVNYGWQTVKDTYKGTIGYKWSIDPKTAPVAIEVLAPTNSITW